MATVADYYRILQITEGSTLAQIKLAYRTRAKQLHPDRNKSHTAHTDFILLTEAYEYLSANPNAKVSYAVYETTYQYSETTNTETRQRAQSYANMQYDDFVQSDYYKQSEALEVVARHFYLVFVAFCLAGLFSFFVFVLGPIGVLISLVFAALFGPVLYYLAIANGPIGVGALGKALQVVVNPGKIAVAIIGVFNLFVFFKIGLQTLIPFALLWKAYLLLMLIGYGLWKTLQNSEDRFKTYVMPLCLTPLLFSILLVVNFVISNNPVTEKYEFNPQTRPGRRGEENTTMINLPNNTYNAYPGVRTFLNYEEMQGMQTITYTFADGLLGIRVMKDYKFE